MTTCGWYCSDQAGDPVGTSSSGTLQNASGRSLYSQSGMPESW